VSAFPAVAHIEVTRRHPCFDGEAHNQVGRVHLPIAPRCNIQCNFCERNICASMAMQHPGWTAKVLAVGGAVELVRSIMCSRATEDFVVGVAGPGDPLANEETFETLRLIHQEYPELLKCISTNGLLLEDKLPQVLEVGIRALTVTVNAPDSGVGKHIYSWVKYQGTIYREEEAAALLIAKQFSGIRKALDADLSIKVNTVLIPSINDRHMMRLALLLREAGVRLMNIMPLIPSGKMKSYRAPTCDELRKARRDCGEIVSQFYRCEQCRADVVYLP
jgi:nitrogen fixation protein NifB